jgi:hypothetical protein
MPRLWIGSAAAVLSMRAQTSNATPPEESSAPTTGEWKTPIRSEVPAKDKTPGTRFSDHALRGHQCCA